MQRVLFNIVSTTLLIASTSFAHAAGSASLRASNKHIGKECPITVRFYGSIRSDSAGEVQYRFKRSDGALAPIQKMRFDKPGAKRLATTWRIGRNYSGWQQIEILYPNAATSPRAAFDVRCGSDNSRPDLKVSISAPSTAKPGDNLSQYLSVKATNRGNRVAAGSKQGGYMIDVFLSSDRLYPSGHADYSPNYKEDVLLKGGRISNTDGLAPNTSKTYQVGGTIPADTPDGNYWLCARIDAGNKVFESSESNNASCAAIYIRKQQWTAPETLSEDCVDFSPNQIRIKKRDGRYVLEDQGHRLFSFATRLSAQRMRLTVMRYQATQSCFVGRPNAPFSYMLRSGESLKGSIFGESCSKFDRKNLRVRRLGSWKLVDGNEHLFDFADNEAAARKAHRIIKKYRFNYSCSVGFPNGHGYLRR